MQSDALEFQWNEFKVRAAAKHFSHHGFIFNWVEAAGGVHQVPTGNKQRGTSSGDFNLHLEHLPTLFWRPIPPYISIFSRGGRTSARDISDYGIKTRGREPSEMAPIVLGHNDVGKSQTAFVAHQHVEPARDRLVGHHDPFGMESLSELSRFRTRSGAHVQREDVLFSGEQAHWEHAGRFLPCDAPCFVKQRHQPLREAFGCFATGKRHHERCFGRHPRKFNGTDGLDLFDGPLPVGSVKRDAKRFGKWFKRRVQPRFFVPAQVANKGSERGLLSIRSSLLCGIGRSSHMLGSSVLSFGLPP